MSVLSEFFLGAPYLVQYDCLELLHANFANASGWHVVRNACQGVTVTHEDAAVFLYDYYPMSIKPVGSSSDLTQALSVTFGDLGLVMGSEIKALHEANAMGVRPVAKFRTYRSDDLSTPMSGPLVLEVVKVTADETGCTLECQAPNVNNTKNGTEYSIEQFPMLRGFL